MLAALAALGAGLLSLVVLGVCGYIGYRLVLGGGEEVSTDPDALGVGFELVFKVLLAAAISLLLASAAYIGALIAAARALLPPGQRLWAVLVGALTPYVIDTTVYGAFSDAAGMFTDGAESATILIVLSIVMWLLITLAPAPVAFYIAARRPLTLQRRQAERGGVPPGPAPPPGQAAGLGEP